MKVKFVVFAVLPAFICLSMDSGAEAVNTRDIDIVRQKAVLNQQDFAVIDRFLDEAIRELVKTKDFTSIGNLRMVIVQRRSDQGQYAEQFSESAHKHLTSGLQQALGLPPERQIKVIVNLLILIDGLEDLRQADLALAMLKYKNTVIRYWAVHCLTNPGIVKQLNSPGPTNLKNARTITAQLKTLVQSGSPEVMSLMTRFAAEVKIPQGEELLVQIADERIKRYAGWKVKHELLDGIVLNALYSKIGTGNVNKAVVARRFGQLYSYVLQRYVKGKQRLSKNQKQQLASVLVDTEEKCISKLLGQPQTTIRKAIERDDDSALVAEHNRLLGGGTQDGQLPTKLKYDYGTSGGTKRTAPFALPNPPKPKPTK